MAFAGDLDRVPQGVTARELHTALSHCHTDELRVDLAARDRGTRGGSPGD
jgi:hypothetical protein